MILLTKEITLVRKGGWYANSVSTFYEIGYLYKARLLKHSVEYKSNRLILRIQ